MHARLVYYVYIGKSRDFTRILKDHSSTQRNQPLEKSSPRDWPFCIFIIMSIHQKAASKNTALLYPAAR